MNGAPPAEIKAQAVAMMCLGYSARHAERELRRKYPGADIPRYSTISRWLASSEAAHAARRSSYWQWQLVAQRVCEIVYERMDEFDIMNGMQLLRAYKIVMRVYEAGIDNMNRRQLASRR